MIGTSNNSVKKSYRRIDDDINIERVFFLYGNENLLKVDTIDMIMDKLESMNPFSHIIIIIFSYNNLIKRKTRYSSSVVSGFEHISVDETPHTLHTK